jgi:hypothetical protein
LWRYWVFGAVVLTIGVFWKRISNIGIGNMESFSNIGIGNNIFFKIL